MTALPSLYFFCFRSPSPNLHSCLSEALPQVIQPSKNISFADFENLSGRKTNKLNERSGKVAATAQQIPPNTTEHFAEP